MEIRCFFLSQGGFLLLKFEIKMCGMDGRFFFLKEWMGGLKKISINDIFFIQEDNRPY